MFYHLACKEDGTWIIRRHIQEFGHLLHHAICRPIERMSTSPRQLDVARKCDWAYRLAYTGSWINAYNGMLSKGSMFSNAAREGLVKKPNWFKSLVKRHIISSEALGGDKLRYWV